MIFLLALLPVVWGYLISVAPDYSVSFQQNSKELSHAVFTEKNFLTGWNYLHIYTNIAHSLLDQHRGAGFAQGYATYKEIHAAYVNYQSELLKSGLPSKAQNFIDEQMDYIDKMVRTFQRDQFWEYVGAKMEQLRYMYRGYLTRLHKENRLDMLIGWNQFYYLTNMGDLEDLLPAFQQAQRGKTAGEEFREGRRNCNGIVQLVNGLIHMAHSTHNNYALLLRIFKTYHFPSFNQKAGSQSFSFSSRPGDLNSKDDFYVMSNGLKVMETSLQNFRYSNYADLKSKSLPVWLRVNVAVHLANTGDQFIEYFLRERSGTHNNQWVVVDPAQITEMKNLIQFVEEGFSEYEVVDMTKLFYKNGYVASYNVPYTEAIYKKLGYEQYPYDYDSDPRAAIYKKYAAKIKDEEDMKYWFINNQQDQVTDGLAPRYDLKPENPTLFGLTDCKIISPSSEKNNFVWAFSGPSTSHGRFKPFSWANWPGHSHQGIAPVWNFDWVKFPLSIEKPVMQVEISTI